MPRVAKPRKRTKAPPSRALFVLLMLCMGTLLRMAMLTAPVALLFGCVINLDSGSPGASAGSGPSMENDDPGIGDGSNMDPSTDPVHRLPPPSIGALELPVLDADMQKRFDEVAQYLWDRYEAAGWQIKLTVQTPIGDVIDWIDKDSVKGSDVEPPPLPTPEEMQLPDGVQLSLTELDLFPELRGPPGTIPVIRPSFAAYVMGLSGASSLEDFFSKYVVPGDPDGQNRLYAGMIFKDTPNLGVSTFINAFNGQIDFNTVSLLEMVVGCRDPNTNAMRQQIGIAASKDWASTSFWNFGDSILRLQVEFLTAGSRQEDLGEGKGGWHGTKSIKDFIPVGGALYAPGMAIVPSTIGGPQFEARYDIQFKEGNWWVGWNGSWLGYYPGKLFNELSSQACEALWYGEVYDPSATTTQRTPTDMGSGQFANAGFGKAAHFRNPFYIDTSGMSQWPAPVFNLNPRNDACYTRSDLFIGQTPLDRIVFVGGPGGDAPNCPMPHQALYKGGDRGSLVTQGKSSLQCSLESR